MQQVALAGAHSTGPLQLAGVSGDCANREDSSQVALKCARTHLDKWAARADNGLSQRNATKRRLGRAEMLSRQTAATSGLRAGCRDGPSAQCHPLVISRSGRNKLSGAGSAAVAPVGRQPGRVEPSRSPSLSHLSLLVASGGDNKCAA